MRAFTDKQIELVTHFRRPGGDRDRERAAVRREYRPRTHDLSEASRAANRRPHRCYRVISKFLPASCSQFSTQFGPTLPGFVKPITATCGSAREIILAPGHSTALPTGIHLKQWRRHNVVPLPGPGSAQPCMPSRPGSPTKSPDLQREPRLPRWRSISGLGGRCRGYAYIARSTDVQGK